MATKFGREPKMQTTEPSDDEVGGGMKRGGHAHKKHMAMGGEMPPTPMRGRAGMAGSRGALLSKPRVSMPMPPPAMGAGMPPGASPAMKKGGKMHHHAEGGDVAQDKAMIKKAFKQHDAQEHKGAKGTHLSLKKGGKTHHYAKGGGVKDAGPDTPGGLLGGIEATRPVSKKGTGTILGPGYKHGGHTKKHHMAKGGTMHPAIDVQDKVVEAKQTKSLSTKTGGVEGKGYKHGGHTKKHHMADGGTVPQSVAGKYLNDMHDGEKMPTKKGKTGEIKQQPAGYKRGGHVKHEHHKHGGHVEHHTTHGHKDHGHEHMHKHVAKHHHGHDKIDGHPMKHGGSARHHTTKVSTHKKKGGACNY
jgi:hypothetical protein